MTLASEWFRIANANVPRPEFASAIALIDAGWKWRLVRFAHEAEMQCFRESPEGAAIMVSIEDHARRSGGGS